MASRALPAAIKIKTVNRKQPDGTTKQVEVYWFRVDVGRDAAGKRQQVYKSSESQKEIKAEYARIVNETNNKTFVRPRKLTLSQYLDEWIEGHCRDLEKATKRNYQDALRPVHERLGQRPLQSIEKRDVEQLVTWMTTSGRKKGGEAGTGLGPRSVQLTLTRLSAALAMAANERKIPLNPVPLVKRPKMTETKRTVWSDAEEAAFFELAARDRIAVVIELFSYGLRPEEVCGVRWIDVDLTAGEIHVGRNVRTMVSGEVDEKGAKTDAGERTLPLDDRLSAGLKSWKARQAAEKLAAGEAYEAAGYVLCDELGAPWKTDRLRRYMYSLMKQAGVTKITPYEAMRHGAASRMARARVPEHIAAAWMGHKSYKTTAQYYVHARREDLAEARDVFAARA